MKNKIVNIKKELADINRKIDSYWESMEGKTELIDMDYLSHLEGAKRALLIFL